MPLLWSVNLIVLRLIVTLPALPCIISKAHFKKRINASYSKATRYILRIAFLKKLTILRKNCLKETISSKYYMASQLSMC